jgi:hypothetical protein
VVRKQLYISDEHERALKARARELGISEAELVRRMLDSVLLDGEGEGMNEPTKTTDRSRSKGRGPRSNTLHMIQAARAACNSTTAVNHQKFQSRP